MPWIIDEVEERIQTALGTDIFSSLEISSLRCKSWVANELFDLLTCLDLPDHGLDKFILSYPKFWRFEEEVISRLANICSRLSYLQLSHICDDQRDFTDEGRMQMLSLFR